MIRINGNQFIDNSAAIGGGISSASLQTQFVLYNNIFDNNSATRAAGLALFSGEHTISKNRFQNHQGQETILLAIFQGTFENNAVVSNNTHIGLYMAYGSPPFPRFSNNIIARSGTNAILALGSQPGPLFAELENNTMVGGGGGAAISIPANNYVTLSLTNNIIAGFPIGLDNNSPSSSTITSLYTLFAPDVANHGNNVNFDHAITGDPAFMNPATNDYHIRFISVAKDAGTSAIVTTEDIDGDPRPIGSAPDIGADEYRPLLLHLPLIKKSFSNNLEAWSLPPKPHIMFRDISSHLPDYRSGQRLIDAYSLDAIIPSRTSLKEQTAGLNHLVGIFCFGEQAHV
jgi:hypothetical protein